MIIIDVKAMNKDSICKDIKIADEIFKKIKESFDKEEKVLLNFSGISHMTSDFIQTSVGRLYGEKYKKSFIKNNLKYDFICGDLKAIFKGGIKVSKTFYEQENRLEYNVYDV